MTKVLGVRGAGKPGRPGKRGAKGSPGVTVQPQDDGSLAIEATDGTDPAPVAIAVPPPPTEGEHALQVIDGAVSWVPIQPIEETP